MPRLLPAKEFMRPSLTLFPYILTTLLAWAGFSPVNCLGLNAASGCYELKCPALDASDEVTLEAWVQVDPQCPEGARIFDKWGIGSQEGYRLEIGTNCSLAFVTTSPEITRAQCRLPVDRPAHVIAVFSPRQTVASVYVDGDLVASVPAESRRWHIPSTSTPLRIGADQDGGNPFRGIISRVAVYNKALDPLQVSARFDRQQSPVSRLGEWQLPAEPRESVQPLAGQTPLRSPLQMDSSGGGPASALALWYRRPAREWVEALPVGNGRLGAMVFGTVPEERLQLNEDTIWGGGPYDSANPAAPETYRKARELIFAGKQQEAEELIRQSGMAIPLNQAPYQTLGNLRLKFAAQNEPITDYCRSLILKRPSQRRPTVAGGLGSPGRYSVRPPTRSL